MGSLAQLAKFEQEIEENIARYKKIIKYDPNKHLPLRISDFVPGKETFDYSVHICLPKFNSNYEVVMNCYYEIPISEWPETAKRWKKESNAEFKKIKKEFKQMRKELLEMPEERAGEK